MGGQIDLLLIVAREMVEFPSDIILNTSCNSAQVLVCFWDLAVVESDYAL